jgi:2-amino-4-hydroxy-6-hydroxymethyldihydropteridine diphosphokinase
LRQVWIALGGNLGDRPATLLRAVEMLRAAGLPAQRLSHLYETAPEGGRPEPLYLNAVLQSASDGEPEEILGLLQGIEAALGRRMEARSGPRTCDLDLLALGDLVREEAPPPLLPHPRLHLRAFVLVPLCELDVHWRHPLLLETAGELLAKLPREPGAVRLFGELPAQAAGAGLILAGSPSRKGC